MTRVNQPMGYDKQLAEARANFHVARVMSQTNPLQGGVPSQFDLKLEGQVGFASALNFSTLITSRTQTLIDARVVGDSAEAVRSCGIALTFVVLGSPAQRAASLLNVLISASADITYGAGGINKTVTIDILGEPTVVIPASNVSCSVFGFGVIGAGNIVPIGAYATLDYGNKLPHVSTLDILANLAPAAVSTSTVPNGGRRVKVMGTQPGADAFLVNFRNRAGVLLYAQNTPPDWVDLNGEVRTVDVVNAGAGLLSGRVLVEQTF